MGKIDGGFSLWYDGYGFRYLPQPDSPGPEAPGPYAFRNPDRVARILSEAGFIAIGIVSDERVLQFEPDVESTVLQLIQYGGPMATAIAEAPEEVRERIKADLADMARPYQTSEGVMIDGAVWVVSAES